MFCDDGDTGAFERKRTKRTQWDVVACDIYREYLRNFEKIQQVPFRPARLVRGVCIHAMKTSDGALVEYRVYGMCCAPLAAICHMSVRVCV